MAIDASAANLCEERCTARSEREIRMHKQIDVQRRAKWREKVTRKREARDQVKFKFFENEWLRGKKKKRKGRKSARIEMEYRRYCNALYYKKYQEREERRTKLF